MEGAVGVYGGFYGDETLFSERDVNANVTIIDASSLVAASKYHVVTFNGVTSILDGFTITGGAATGSSPDNKGGGIYLNNSANNQILNCTVIGNSSDAQGGGIYGYDSSVQITNCTIADSTAAGSDGGIIIQNDSTADISGCRIYGNYSADEGGGINIDVNDGTGSTISDSIIASNESVYSGGGIYAHDTTIERCVISGNKDADGGGGIYSNDFYGPQIIRNCLITGNSAPIGGGIRINDAITLINNTIAGNTASTNGGGLYLPNAAYTMIITNNIFYNNTNYAIYECGINGDPTVTYNNFDCGLPTRTG